MGEEIIEVYWDARALLPKQVASGCAPASIECLRLFRAVRNIVAEQFPENQTDTRILSRGRGEHRPLRVVASGRDLVGPEVEALAARVDAAIICFKAGYFRGEGDWAKIAV